MPHKEINVKIRVPQDTPVRLRDKEAQFQVFADLPQADFDRLLQLAKNPKALKGLAENWQMLKGMF